MLIQTFLLLFVASTNLLTSFGLTSENINPFGSMIRIFAVLYLAWCMEIDQDILLLYVAWCIEGKVVGLHFPWTLFLFI